MHALNTKTLSGCSGFSSSVARHTQRRRVLKKPSQPASASASKTTTTTSTTTTQTGTAMPPTADLPATYKRLVAKRVGTCFSEVAELEEVPVPQPGPNEVLVRLQYAGINGGCETFRTRGEGAFTANKSKAEYALGAEGAGVIAAVGSEVKGCLTVGQPVACNGAAAFAEYGLAPAHMLTPVQAATPEVVALTLSGVTAAASLEHTAKVQPGEVVLVTAAAGGTGHFAVQLAQLAGARVVAVAGSESKKQKLQALGLERVINYKQEDVGAVLSAEYPQGVNVVYEGVGGALRAAIMPHLAPGARVLQVGYISEYAHTGVSQVSAAEGGYNMEQLFWQGKCVDLEQGKKVFGQIWPKDVTAIRASRQKVFDLYNEGKLKAWVDVSHGYKGVEQIPQAIDYMLQGGHTGKVVIPL